MATSPPLTLSIGVDEFIQLCTVLQTFLGNKILEIPFAASSWRTKQKAENTNGPYLENQSTLVHIPLLQSNHPVVVTSCRGNPPKQLDVPVVEAVIDQFHSIEPTLEVGRPINVPQLSHEPVGCTHWTRAGAATLQVLLAGAHPHLLQHSLVLIRYTRVRTNVFDAGNGRRIGGLSWKHLMKDRLP